jgi:hypothetical protein
MACLALSASDILAFDELLAANPELHRVILLGRYISRK